MFSSTSLDEARVSLEVAMSVRVRLRATQVCYLAVLETAPAHDDVTIGTTSSQVPAGGAKVRCVSIATHRRQRRRHHHNHMRSRSASAAPRLQQPMPPPPRPSLRWRERDEEQQRQRLRVRTRARPPTQPP